MTGFIRKKVRTRRKKMDIQKIFNEVSMLNFQIKDLLKELRYESCDDLSYCDYDNTDPQQLFLVDEMQHILEGISDISRGIDYLNTPVKVQGTLHKSPNGRYCVKNYELTSGCGLEYLCEDNAHSRYDSTRDEYVSQPYWTASRIEHNGKDYYLCGTNQDIELEGLKVRIRR
jgi:hypothetical protein